MADDYSLEIEVKGLKSLIKKLESATRREVFFKTLNQGGQLLARWSKANRLSGPRPTFLGVVTNRLRSSITAGQPQSKGNIYFEEIGTNVDYAKIHEFGGFAGRNRKVFIRARPFLKPALEDEGNQKEILDILTEQVNEALTK